MEELLFTIWIEGFLLTSGNLCWLVKWGGRGGGVEGGLLFTVWTEGFLHTAELSSLGGGLFTVWGVGWLPFPLMCSLPAQSPGHSVATSEFCRQNQCRLIHSAVLGWTHAHTCASTHTHTYTHKHYIHTCTHAHTGTHTQTQRHPHTQAQRLHKA